MEERHYVMRRTYGRHGQFGHWTTCGFKQNMFNCQHEHIREQEEEIREEGEKNREDPGGSGGLQRATAEKDPSFDPGPPHHDLSGGGSPTSCRAARRGP